MKPNALTVRYVDQAFLRYQTARQEVDSTCCLTDTRDFVENDVMNLIGIIHAMADELDARGVFCFHAQEFATGFSKTP